MEEDEIAAPQVDGDLIQLDAALDSLATKDRRKAELVKLRFYAGLTIPEAAAVLGISEATAQRDWTYARTWLYCLLADQAAPADSPDNPATA